ncbi:MAG: transglycosylase SLT domain-containing protein [Anaerolineales bacterium]
MALTFTSLDASTTHPAALSAPASGGGDIAPLFTPEVQYWAANITQWAKNAGIDPNLAATVMQIESCGDPRARSHAGATGLFQVMPFHFKSGENAYTPDTNALRGLDYLARALTAANGDARLALAGYNGGISVIRKPESQWAAETRRYTYWGSGIYADALAGKSQSARLDEWLRAGGASLCRQAAERLGLGK